jgi:hypothetical protein
LKIFKKREDFSPEEEVTYLRDRTIPEIDEEERAALEAAGFSSDRRPLAEVQAERKALIEREEEIEDAEAMSPEEHSQARYGTGDGAA